MNRCWLLRVREWTVVYDLSERLEWDAWKASGHRCRWNRFQWFDLSCPRKRAESHMSSFFGGGRVQKIDRGWRGIRETKRQEGGKRLRAFFLLFLFVFVFYIRQALMSDCFLEWLVSKGSQCPIPRLDTEIFFKDVVIYYVCCSTSPSMDGCRLMGWLLIDGPFDVVKCQQSKRCSEDGNRRQPDYTYRPSEYPATYM